MTFDDPRLGGALLTNAQVLWLVAVALGAAAVIILAGGLLLRRRGAGAFLVGAPLVVAFAAIVAASVAGWLTWPLHCAAGGPVVQAEISPVLCETRLGIPASARSEGALRAEAAWWAAFAALLTLIPGLLLVGVVGLVGRGGRR